MIWQQVPHLFLLSFERERLDLGILEEEDGTFVSFDLSPFELGFWNGFKFCFEFLPT